MVMEVQMIDLEYIEAQCIRKIEKYQQRYNLTHADVAWILLRLLIFILPIRQIF